MAIRPSSFSRRWTDGSKLGQVNSRTLTGRTPLINAAFPDLQPVLRLHLGCRCRPTDAHFDVQAALDGFSCCRAVRDYAIAGLPPRR
jgi:hypothetical protein